MRLYALVVALAVMFAPSAPASAQSEPAPAPKARAFMTFTALDDARACLPLAHGGFAVATGGGLALIARDGSMRALTSIDGLPETRVHAVAEQDAGVWVGTEAGAAFVTLEGAGAPRVLHTALTAPVHVIHITASGVVYLGTRGAGVFRISRDRAPELVRTTARGTRATAMAERNGVLYVAFADGPLARLEGDSLAAIPGSPTHGQSLAVVGDDVVLGDLEGLYRLDSRGTFSAIASVDARGLAQAGSSFLAATYGGGLVSGTPGGALRAGDASVAKLARSVAVRGTSRCVATTEGVFVDEGTGSFHALSLGGPTSNDVTAIAVSADGARVAVGTFDSGASIYERGIFTRVSALDEREVVNGLAWQGDRLWIATVHGLLRVDPRDGTARRFTARDGLPSTYARVIHVLSTDRVLIGTEAGPAIVDGDRVAPLLPTTKGTPASIASPMHATWAVASSPDGTLYIGTSTGLYFGKDGRYQRASLAGGELEDDWVTALAIDGRDVYVGTYAKGVTRLRFTNRRPEITQLGGGYVNADGLVVSGGQLYAATMDHLLVRPTSDEASSWAISPLASTGRDVTAIRFVTRGAASVEAWVSSRRGIGITR